MSKLDELIRELCPDGVEFRKVGDIANISRGKVMSKDFLKENAGEYPVYSSQTENEGKLGSITTYMFDGEYLTWTTDGANAGTVFYRSGKFSVTNVCGVIDNISEDVNKKYLYYVLNRVAPTYVNCGMGNPKLMSNVMARISLPIPPLEIQREIVRILDNFTNLTAELTARKAQYSYYRDKLLINEIESKFKRLEECCDSIADGDHQPPPKAETGTPFITISDITERRTIDFSKSKYVPDEYYNHLADKRKPKKGDVLYTVVGSYGIPVYIPENIRFVFQRHIAILKPNNAIVDSRYLYHVMNGTGFHKQADLAAKGAAQKTIGLTALSKMTVPVPPIDVQKRIVEVLDNFEKICSDLNIGLPAEIEARQKQYEYYRDKLLTFAENCNTILSRAEQSRALIKLLQYVFGYAVVSLQDVVKNSCSGGTPKKGVSEYYEDGNIPWLRTQEVVFRDICKTECFITESAVKNSAAKWIPENCVIVAISGATAGRCAINKIPLTTNQHCLNLEVDPEMALYRYVYYCICAKQEELLAKKEGARGDLNSTRILSLQIDLPSIEEQKRIISILDRFDSICNDLTSGLPAEIEARRKQYEYYRDKLLTFKEVAAT